MHFTHMALRNQLEDLNLKTNDYGWGAMIPFSSIKKGIPLEGAGGYVNLPVNFINTTGASTDNMLDFPESDYACLGRYGMPYETQDLLRLLDWINAQGYRLTGNVMDECLLDTTYYTDEIKRISACLWLLSRRAQNHDFCMTYVLRKHIIIIIN